MTHDDPFPHQLPISKSYCMMTYFSIHSSTQKIFILPSVPGTVLGIVDITLNLIQHNLTILIQIDECDFSLQAL